MSKRIWNGMFGAGSLIIGGILYAVFRGETYIGKIVNQMIPMDGIRTYFDEKQANVLQFYLPDLLWAFALSCGLHAIYSPRLSGSILCAVVAILFGWLWEILQYTGVVSGTGDVWDMTMYFLGGALCVLINLGGKKNEK